MNWDAAIAGLVGGLLGIAFCAVIATAVNEGILWSGVLVAAVIAVGLAIGALQALGR